MTAPRTAVHQRTRVAFGCVLLALFLAMVALWTAYGFNPELSVIAPEPFAAYGRPGEFWPIGAAFIAGFGAAVTLAPGLQIKDDGDERGVGVSPLAAAVLAPSAVLIAFAAYWPCSRDEAPVWSSLRHALEAFEGYIAEPFGVVRGCPAEFPQGLMAAVLFAKVALALTLGLAIAYVFQHSIHKIRAGLARQVVVIAGLDEDTIEAARAIRKNLSRRQKLVVFDRESHPGRGRARALAREIGALVLSTDVTDPASVESFMRSRGSRGIQGLYLLSPDSAANIRAMESFLAWSSSLRKDMPARSVEQRDIKDALMRARGEEGVEADGRIERARRQVVVLASHLSDENGWREHPLLLVTLARFVTSVARAFVTTPSEVPPRVVIRIDNPWHAEDWRQREMIGHPGWLFDAVSVYEIAARHVVERAKQEGIDHVVIGGSSPFELAILSELSFGHRVDVALSRVSTKGERDWDVTKKAFARYKPRTPTAVLVGPKAQETESYFALQLRRFGVEDVGKLLKLEQGTPVEVMERFQADSKPALVLNDIDDYDPSFLALQHPRWRMFKWSMGLHGLTKTNLMGALSMVGPTLEPVPGWGLDIWERLGRIQHLSYLLQWRGGQTDLGDPKRGNWDSDLDAFTKESNIRAFATICRTVGGFPSRRVWATDLGPDGSQHEAPLTPDERVAAAIREHISWMQHHLEYGWALGAPRGASATKSGKPSRALVHPDLVDWDALSDEERKKDFDSVDSTLRLLTTLGFTLTGAAVYSRVPSLVAAEVLSSPWEWKTGNGDRLTASVGDIRLTDPESGVQWSITASALNTGYLAVGENRYETYGAVTARQIGDGSPEEIILSLEGPESAKERDWVVTDYAGNEWVVTDSVFSERYQATRHPAGD